MNNIIINKSHSLKNALILINKNKLGVCIVVNDEKKLFGILTDGDIRRALIKKNINLNTKIEIICNKKVKFLFIQSSNNEIQSILSDKIKIIPLINKQKKVIDFATNQKFRNIPISEPYLSSQEFINVKKCLESNWISSKGMFVTKFEQDFSKFLGRPSITVSNGTTGLELALKTLNLKKDSEVILPVLTFAATCNAIINSNLKPVFVDIYRESLTIDISQIEKKISRKTKAIIAVHLYGFPCNMKELRRICKKYKLFLIEDCAEAIGSELNRKKIGTFSDISVFSFFGNKTITTGEGGMVCFSNKKHLGRAKILRDHGMSLEKKYWHDLVGNNYRLTNLQAALGCAQLKKLQKIVKKKISIALKYELNFKKIKSIKYIKIQKKIKNSFWLYPIYIKNLGSYKKRDQFLEAMLQHGVEGRCLFYPLSEMKIYKKFTNKEKFPVASEVAKNSIVLPTSYQLTKGDIKWIILVVSNLLNEI
jgi:perosamine synthetase